MFSTIRSAKPQDVETIADIHRRSRADAMPWLPVVHTPAEDYEFFSRLVIGSQTVLVAEADREIIGFAAFDNDWLNHLYLTPSAQRKGMGTALLSEVKAAVPRIQLWTFQKNHAARQFYTRHGFIEVEFTDGSSNEEQTPDVLMVWTRSQQP